METYYTVQFCTAKSSTCTAYCFHPLNGSKWCVVNDAVCAHYISTLQCVAFDFMTGTLGMKHSTEDFCVLRNLEANTVILNQKMRSKPKLLAWEIQPGEMREGGLDWQERNRSQIATKAVQKQYKSSTKAVQKQYKSSTKASKYYFCTEAEQKLLPVSNAFAACGWHQLPQTWPGNQSETQGSKKQKWIEKRTGEQI